MLIKKTIVLTLDSAVGYVTLVRVGSSVGVKVILNSAPKGKLYMGLRVGTKPQLTLEITGRRTEKEVDLELMPTDELGTIIVDEGGKLYAYGGRKEAVNRDKILNASATANSVEIEGDKKGRTSENPVTVAEVQENVESENPITVAEVEKKEDENSVKEEPIAAVDIDHAKTTTETHEYGSDAGKPANNFLPFSENKGENFYRNVRSKLEEIMTANPREEALEKLIPESKWVKVYYDEDEYYVVGILAEAGEVSFLAYGVPGIEGIKPPKEAEELCDFLPLPDTVGEGYWLMFQNAKTGDIMSSLT